MQVTARNIGSLPVGTHRAERCLYLRKREGHAPTWVFRYTVSGKQKDVVIGTADAVTIAQAKETAARFRTMIADGVDPLAAKQERRARRGEIRNTLHSGNRPSSSTPSLYWGSCPSRT